MCAGGGNLFPPPFFLLSGQELPTRRKMDTWPSWISLAFSFELDNHKLMSVIRKWSILVSLLLTFSASANSPTKTVMITTPDGVKIAAQDWGNPNGLEILFIHGFSQSHLSWQRQVESELSRNFRM